MYVKQPFHWSHYQELDLLELGLEPARHIKGENDRHWTTETRERLIAGRAKRALERALREKRERESAAIWGRRPTWFQEAVVDKVASERDFERRRVSVREKKVAALQRENTQLKTTLKVIDETARKALR